MKLYSILVNFLIVDQETSPAGKFMLPSPAGSAQSTFKTENGQLRNRSFVAILSRHSSSGDLKLAKKIKEHLKVLSKPSVSKSQSFNSI